MTGKIKPPEWLITSPTAVDFKYSTDSNDWIFRGSYFDWPDSVDCIKCGADNFSYFRLENTHG